MLNKFFYSYFVGAGLVLIRMLLVSTFYFIAQFGRYDLSLEMTHAHVEAAAGHVAPRTSSIPCCSSLVICETASEKKYSIW